MGSGDDLGGGSFAGGSGCECGAAGPVAGDRARQRHVQAALTPQTLKSLPPAERAWVSKQTDPAAVLVLEALSRALPDQAYLAELELENGTLRRRKRADPRLPCSGSLSVPECRMPSSMT